MTITDSPISYLSAEKDKGLHAALAYSWYPSCEASCIILVERFDSGIRFSANQQLHAFARVDQVYFHDKYTFTCLCFNITDYPLDALPLLPLNYEQT